MFGTRKPVPKLQHNRHCTTTRARTPSAPSYVTMPMGTTSVPKYLNVDKTLV